MPDRILRDEIWESDRFLDLPTDAARLAFIRFLNMCDDFGNFEGGPRRLYRILHACTQIKTEQAASEAIDALMQADLIRRYEVGDRELFHIPRLRPHTSYLVRKMPPSPWDEVLETGKAKWSRRTVRTKGLAKDQELTKNLTVTLQQCSSDAGPGVVVGVGVGVGEKSSATHLSGSAQKAAPKPDVTRPEEWDFKQVPAIGKEPEYILAFFNKVTNSRYRAVDANIRMIRARLTEHPVKSMKYMIVHMLERWRGDEKMEQYIRPQTFFNATNCQSYIELARKHYEETST